MFKFKKIAYSIILKKDYLQQQQNTKQYFFKLKKHIIENPHKHLIFMKGKQTNVSLDIKEGRKNKSVNRSFFS